MMIVSKRGYETERLRTQLVGDWRECDALPCRAALYIPGPSRMLRRPRMLGWKEVLAIETVQMSIRLPRCQPFSSIFFNIKKMIELTDDRGKQNLSLQTTTSALVS